MKISRNNEVVAVYERFNEKIAVIEDEAENLYFTWIHPEEADVLIGTAVCDEDLHNINELPEEDRTAVSLLIKKIRQKRNGHEI